MVPFCGGKLNTERSREVRSNWKSGGRGERGERRDVPLLGRLQVFSITYGGMESFPVEGRIMGTYPGVRCFTDVILLELCLIISIL